MEKIKNYLKGGTRNKLIVLAIIVASVFIVSNVVIFGVVNSNPVYKTLNAIIDYGQRDTYQVSISVKTDTDTDLDDLLEMVDTSAGFTFDKSNGELGASFSADYKDDTIVDGVIQVNDEYIFVDSPSALGQYDYLFFELDTFFEKSMLRDIGAYMNLVDFKGFSKKLYADNIYDSLKGSIKSDMNTVTYEFDGKDIYELLKIILETAEEDEKLIPWIERESLQILNRMIKDDFEFSYLDDDNFEEVIELIEDGDLEDELEDSIERMLDELSLYEDEMIKAFDDLELVLEFEFNILGKLKGLNIVMEIEGNEVAMKLDFTKGAKVEKPYSEAKGVELGDLKGGDLYDYLVDILEHGVDVITSHDELEDRINDGLEDIEAGFIIDDIEILIEEELEEIFDQLPLFLF